jgi:anhydro-N-acetylmuramic acid kinase
MSERPTLVVGLMSGTSLDGMDAALVRFEGPTHASLLAFITRSYDAGERGRIEAAIDRSTARDLALLHADLAVWATEAVQAVLDAGHVRAVDLDLIGFHGQTVWHEPPRVTWQLGEPAIIAERFGVRVVSGFRGRDVAAGGEGAPLVSMADVLLFGADHPRVLLNLGGMANLTYVPRRAVEEGMLAFDTGPGMAIIDTVARIVSPGLPYDRDGVLASTGSVDRAALSRRLGDPYFSMAPPKSTGRERFGTGYARALADEVPGPDGVRTAVELTAASIADQVRRWTPRGVEVVASGGGCHHPVLWEALVHRLGEEGRALHRFDDVFFPGDAKEAVAFALLAYLSAHGQPGNVPAATGATGHRVLGVVTPP